MLKPVHPKGFRKLSHRRGVEVEDEHLRLYWEGYDASTPTVEDNFITVVLTDDDKVWLVQRLLGIDENKDNK